MDRQIRLYTVSAILLFLLPQVHAQSNLNDVSLEDLLNLKVTTATKIEQKQSEAPGIITVIKRDQFRTYGWYTLNDALYHQSGFFPSRDYDRHTVGSRGNYEGWNNNHILLLVDGVPFNDPMYGTAYTSEITPVFMMKSVEVLRGPGSALYGTNAANGVLAIQTVSGQDFNGQADASLRAGSYDTNQWDVITGNTRENFSYVVGASGLSTSGLSYASYDNSGIMNGSDLAKTKIRDNRSNRYVFLKAEGLKELKGLTIEFHDQEWHYQTGTGWLFMVPDQPDIMSEYRQVVTASYKPTPSGKFSNELTLKFEHKENDWYTRYAPNGAYGGFYPYGVTEHLDFTFDHYFGRAQTTWDLGGRANVLAGLESSAFVYNGDKTHLANTDTITNSYAPTPNNEMLPADDALGLITDKPIVNLAAYAQLVTGDWVPKVTFTTGLRYDLETVHYNQAKANPAGTGTGTRSFNQMSPRFAAVFAATDALSLKFLIGRAFRAPAPSELAGVNTWALANNIRGLKPEVITTFELGSDWRLSPSLNWKANAFHTKMEDQIGYNASTTPANLSTNIFTTTTIGVETELNFTQGKASGFANAAYAQRLSETVADTTVSASNKTLTWAPALTANVGAAYNLMSDLKVAGILQYMSEVKRRTSDQGTVEAGKRGQSIPEWYGLDTNVQYKLTKNDQVDLAVRNLLDRQGTIVKVRDSAFDYHVEGINYYATYTHNF